MRFEPNEGQWNPRVKFSAHTPGCNLVLTSREAVLSSSGRQVGLSLVHANPAPRMEGLDRLAARSSYFVGARKQDWRTGVVNYGRVRYRSVYPGIDMVYYGSESRLEYDFVLDAGADPGRIRLKFRGTGRPRLTPEGDLLLDAADARLVQKRPVIYQQDARTAARLELRGRYKLLGGNVVGVELDAYDRSQPVTIDPVLVYSSLLGGTGTDAVMSVKTDKSGMVWVAGYTGTGDLTATDGVFQAATGGGTNVFVAKIDARNSSGASVVYFTYIGGSGLDTVASMAIDAAGSIYLAGSTTSTDFPSYGGNQPSSGGGRDGFMLELKPGLTGTDQLWYSTYIGGSGADDALGVDVDAAGAIYVVGTTQSADFPVTASAYQSTSWGSQDAFIAKYVTSASPSLVYATYLGGELQDSGRAIAVTPSGTVYVAGSTESATFPWAGVPYSISPIGNVDIWVAQMDLTQSGVDSLVYSTYFGGADNDEVRKIAIDASGKLLLTGYTMSKDLPVTPGAYQTSLGGNADVFVARVDLTAPPGRFISYLTYLGGAHGDVAYDIATDKSGNIYVTGYTLSEDFPVSADALVPAFGKGVEVFVAKLNPAVAGAGALVYSSYLGGAGNHVGYALAVGDDGSIFVGGVTNLQDISVTANAAQNAYGGGISDGFLIVLGAN